MTLSTPTRLFLNHSLLLPFILITSCSGSPKSASPKGDLRRDETYDPVPDLMSSVKSSAKAGDEAALRGHLASLARHRDPRGLRVIESLLKTARNFAKSGLSVGIQQALLRGFEPYGSAQALPLVGAYLGSENRPLQKTAQQVAVSLCGGPKLRPRALKRLSFRVHIQKPTNRGPRAAYAADAFYLQVVKSLRRTSDGIAWKPECRNLAPKLPRMASRGIGAVEKLRGYSLQTRVATKEEAGRTFMKATLILTAKEGALKGSTGGVAGINGILAPIRLRRLAGTLSATSFDDLRPAFSR